MKEEWKLFSGWR